MLIHCAAFLVSKTLGDDMFSNQPGAPCQKPRKRPLRALCLGLATLLGVVACLVGFLTFVPPAPYTPLTGQDPARITLLALGDQGTGDLKQWRVARGMERIADSTGGVNMVMLLGDNFYGPDLSGVGDSAWQRKFERVYRGDWLSRVPFYAVLGNHDLDSAAVELEYGRRALGSGRWQMAEPYYTRDFGEAGGRPLLRAVFLDTNQDKAGLQRQVEFLQASFSKPGPAPIWRMVVAHHPLRAVGDRGDNQHLLDALLTALKDSGVDIYLAAHEHNQQLIVRAGEPAWLTSGGGGNDLDNTTAKASHTPEAKPGLLFAEQRHGFARLAFSPERLQVGYYDAEGVRELPFVWERSCSQAAQACLQQAGTVQAAGAGATGQ
jgi:hypothetical protein